MRFRLLFAFLGAIACLLASLLAEAVFTRADLSQTLDDRVGRVLIFRSDIARRLEKVGGKTGDIEVTLAWNSHNDLDLSCVDPHGERIFYGHKHSRSGGELDVDANFLAPFTDEPVENIYWPFGHALKGLYTIQINHYENHSGNEPTPYRVVVLERGHLHQFRGVIWPKETKTIYQFDTSTSGSAWNSLAVSLLRAALVTGFWSLLLATLLALALTGGQQWFWQRRYGQPLVTLKRLGIIVLCGALVGLAAGTLGQLLFSLISYLHSEWPVLIGRALGWALLGLVIGRALAQWVPNLPPRAAAVAGLLAGALGACGFMAALGAGSDLLGRLLAAGLLGLVIGFLINLDIEPLDELEEEYLQPEPFTMQTYRLRAYRGASAGSLRGQRAPRKP
jgi:hypothetical protein